MWALLLVTVALAALWWHFYRSGQTWVEYGSYWSTRIYSRLWHRISYRGPMPWPLAGPMLLVANHTCSADPPFLLGNCPRFIGFVTATEHFRINRLFHWYL